MHMTRLYFFFSGLLFLTLVKKNLKINNIVCDVQDLIVY